MSDDTELLLSALAPQWRFQGHALGDLHDSLAALQRQLGELGRHIDQLDASPRPREAQERRPSR